MGRGRKREKKGRERRKEEREEILVQRSQLADYTPKSSCTATLGSGCGLREWVWLITGCIHFTSGYDDCSLFQTRGKRRSSRRQVQRLGSRQLPRVVGSSVLRTGSVPCEGRRLSLPMKWAESV